MKGIKARIGLLHQIQRRLTMLEDSMSGLYVVKVTLVFWMHLHGHARLSGEWGELYQGRNYSSGEYFCLSSSGEEPTQNEGELVLKYWARNNISRFYKYLFILFKILLNVCIPLKFLSAEA